MRHSPNPLPRGIAFLAPALLFVALWIWVDRQESVTSHRPAADSAAGPRKTKSIRGEHSTLPRGPASTSQFSTPVSTMDTRLPEPMRGPVLDEDFLQKIVRGNTITFTLPDASEVRGTTRSIDRDENGILAIHGRITHPAPGTCLIQRQTLDGVAGPMVGHVRFDGSSTAWKIEPTEDLRGARFIRTHIDQVMCANYAAIPAPAASATGETEEIPQAHPTNIPIPSYQTIIPLQSLPGAAAVVYLDFDGEKGPFNGWGDFDAAPANATNTQIFDVWKMVCEDFQGFNINITTDRKVFDNATPGRRQHVIITPTTDAAPGAGGVAYVGSFNWTESRPCWAFYATGKSACEVISHEVGHTLKLSHDGRVSPAEGYYGGHGSGATGWAPIMGVGYYQNLSQWSKGEYLSANQTQDDLALIDSNNAVDYRTDDAGDALASARYLEIQTNDLVTGEGIIERTGDVDAYRFTTVGGSVTLSVNTVTSNPNIDLLAEIFDPSTSTVIASNNPDTGINASITQTLAAGEYLFRVRGTGRGDPLGTGYTDYGSIGSYLISGSVTGGIKPDRFTIAENTANGSSVGTLTPRNNHGSDAIVFAIDSGNTNGAFSIHPTTGAISVANSSALDYEALSLRWDDPATFELFVSITNAANPSLNESRRTVVTLTDVNESPTATGATVTILERTKTGTRIATVTGSDVDRFDFPRFSITGGNTGNAFAIDAGTGVMTVAADLDVTADTVYNLTITATDQKTPALSVTVPVTVTVIQTAAGYQPGGITRTFFNNITGSTVANLTGNAKFPNNPDSEEYLTAFDGGSRGDNYGSTVRGYLIPPVSGTYRFWIASDDASQLRFTTTTNPASATSIASVASWTDPYAWTTNTSQQSTTFNLTAGQPCYIEARHKEGGGGDHIAVAWTGPGISRQVIPGLYLAPFYQNYAPKVNAATFSIRENAVPGQSVGTVSVSDVNATDTFSAFAITSGNASGAFGIDATTGRVFVAQPSLLNATTTPTLTLGIQTTDNGSPALSGSGTVTVNVLSATGINLTGIAQEIWTGISGSTVATLTSNTNYPFKPSTRRALSSFDSGTGYADNYGSRIRAIFTPAVSGSYQFYIAGDDDSQLFFSSNSNGSGATQIASISGWTDANQWTKYASQTSTARTLTAGVPVYLETRHKEGGGGDHISVGYIGPDAATTTVIPGALLQPFDINASPTFPASSYSYTVNSATATAGTVIATLTATDPNGEAPVHAILSGNTQGAFAIQPSNGRLTIAQPSLLTEGVTILQIAAQDGGLGGTYPLKSATATVTLTVTFPNSPPVFAANPFSKPAATEASPYTGSIAGSASDPNPGNTLSYSKQSGPGWLMVAADGSLSGTPGNDAPGLNSFVIRATDSVGAFSEATLTIQVTDVNFPPSFPANPITASATEDTLFSGQLSANDPDPGQSLTFSRVAGPSWLTVSPSGALSGTPTNANVGSNSLTVRVTDAGGLSADANLLITVSNTNDAPSLAGNPSSLTATEDSSFFTLLTSSDPDVGDTRTFSKISGPAWIAVSPTGQITGTPLNADVGSASLTVQVTDAGGLFTQATFTINVSNTNDAPSLAGNPSSFDATEDSAFDALLSSSDPDTGDTRTFSKISGPAWIAVSPTGQITGTPLNADVGSASLTVQVTDAGGLFTQATFTINVSNTNDAPSLAGNPSSFDATEDSAFDALLSSSDPDTGDTRTFSKISGPAWIAVSPTGQITGTPLNADVGSASLTIQVTDAGGLFAEATFTITVSNTNDAPVFSSPALTSPDASAGSAYTGTISSFATDPDTGEVLAFSKSSGPSWLVIAADGTLSGTPAAEDAGSASFTVRVTDAAGLHAEASLTVLVVNPDPDANDNGIEDEWEIARFGNADPGAHPPTADPDGDGLSNLMEFALDTHPTQAGPSPLEHAIVSAGPERHLQLTIPRNPGATELDFIVEVTSDPGSGSWSSNPLTDVEILENTPSRLVVRDRSPVSGHAGRFIRLRVSSAP